MVFNLEISQALKIPVDHCMDIQCYSYVVARDINMTDKKDLFQQSLEVIIDGVSMSEARENSAQVGCYLMGLLILTKGS